MADFTTGLSYIGDSFTGISILGNTWIFSIIILILCLILLTRAFGHWKIWGFPIGILLSIIGFNVPLLIHIFLFILMGIELMVGLGISDVLALRGRKATEYAINRTINNSKRRISNANQKYIKKGLIKPISQLPSGIKKRLNYDPYNLKNIKKDLKRSRKLLKK